MKPMLGAALALLALAGCNDGARSGSQAQRRLPLSPAEVTLTHSNIAEFDGQVAVLVKMELVGGNTVVTIPAVTSWPVDNTFRGLDHFYSGASAFDHPVIEVKDEGCDELVVDGEACGWTVNYDGCIADGFGCFVSRKSGGPASHGASTQDLVFVLLGDVDFVTNDKGSTFAVHGRFDQDCSGWFSDGRSVYVGADPACEPRSEHTCSLSVDPASLEILVGSWGVATLTVDETGQPPLAPITLSVDPMSLPTGVSVGLVPNPVNPPLPGTSVMTVQTAMSAPVGTTQIVILGEGHEVTGRPFQCRTTLELSLLPPPPPTESGACSCPGGPP